MSKLATAATLSLVALLLAATSTVSSVARTAREFQQGYREGIRAASATSAAIVAPYPAASAAMPATRAPFAVAPREPRRNYEAGFQKGLDEGARRAGRAPMMDARTQPPSTGATASSPAPRPEAVAAQ